MSPIPGIVASSNLVSSPYWFSKYSHNSTVSRVYLTNQFSSGYFYPFMRTTLMRQSKYINLNWQKQGNNIASAPALDLGEAAYIASQNTNFTLSRVNPDGTQVWGRRISGVTNTAVATDGTFIYFVGQFNRSSTDRGLCVTKIDGAGDFMWQREIKRSDNLQMAATSVAYDSSSNSIIINSAFGFDAYCVLKLSASTGSMSWMKQVRFDYSGTGLYISCYGQSSTLSVNPSNGSISFGVQIYQTPGVQNYGVLINLDSSGNLNWARKYGTDNQISPDVATDSSGNVYGLYAVVASPNYRSTIVRYNSSGTQQWSNYLSVVDPNWGGYQPTALSASFATVTSANDTVMFAAGAQFFAYFIRIPADGSKTGTYTIKFSGGDIVGTYAPSGVTTTSETRCAMYNVSYSEAGTSNPLLVDNSYNPVGNDGTIPIRTQSIPN